MTIEEAIENLEAARQRGVKSVILAYWEADQFQREDNEEWEHAAELVERKMDWSGTHDDLAMTLDLYTNE
jgi:hypothetical protein